MTALVGPLLVACAMLALGGAAKALAPLPTRRALYAMRLPSSEPLVRALGIAEVGLALATAVAGGWFALALGLVYGAFAVFVIAAMRNPAVASCGCFGSAATAPTWIHVWLNVALAAVAFASIGIDVVDTLADQPWGGVPLLVLVSIGTLATFLAFTALPALHPRAQPGHASRTATRPLPETTA